MPAFEIVHKGGDAKLKNKYGVYSRQELERQLRQGSFTIKEFASIYSLTPGQMTHILRTLDIDYRNPLNSTRVLDADISDDLHQVLLGTLLGDGYFRTPKCYGLGHGVYQMDYCYHVAEQMHQFVASFGDKDTGGSTEKSFEFWTFRHEVLRAYHDRFYSRGLKKKYFTQESAPDLGPAGLAYWYMDDGKWSSHGAYLCVGKVSEEEGQVLTSLLRNRFDLECTFQCHDARNGNYTIYVTAETRGKFFDIISPYVIPSMKYKLVGSSPPRISFDRDAVVSRHRELCLKAGRRVRYFGDAEISSFVSSWDMKSPKETLVENIRDDIANNRQVSHTCLRELPSEEMLRSMLERGMTDGQVAERYGVGRNTIAALRRSLKIGRRSSRVTVSKISTLFELFEQPDMTIKRAMEETGLSFYKVKGWLKKTGRSKSHQRMMKERMLAKDLQQLDFDPSSAGMSEYVFSKEEMSEEIKNFLKKYEWLKTVGVTAKWCFIMRLRGHLAGVQILNEPAAYSHILGPRTREWECLIQRGCTISWAHEHLGSRMLMMSVNWMIANTEKRVFVGYADPQAGEVGVIYQACNFLYLGDRFGIKNRYRHPTYKKGKSFCEHSLRRTSVFKKWCSDNGVEIKPGWIKPNGFKDVKKIPPEIKKAWYDWGNAIVQESKKVAVDPKGKYVLIKGRDRRETKFLQSLLKYKTYPYPKRSQD